MQWWVVHYWKANTQRNKNSHPEKLRLRVLSIAHEGHLGIVGTKQKLCSKVLYGGLAWRERQRDIVKPATGVSRPTLPQPIRTTPLLTGPWRDLANDLIGPLFTGESILVVGNYYSQYYKVDILKSTIASKVFSNLEEMFADMAYPRAWHPTTDRSSYQQSSQGTWYSKVSDIITSQPK